MASDFLLYGATGFVGAAAARLAVRSGLRPLLAGRDAARLERLAAETDLECRVFGLDDEASMDRALASVPVVLHCAAHSDSLHRRWWRHASGPGPTTWI